MEHAEHPVDHCEAKGRQSVHCPRGNAVGDLLPDHLRATIHPRITQIPPPPSPPPGVPPGGGGGVRGGGIEICVICGSFGVSDTKRREAEPVDPPPPVVVLIPADYCAGGVMTSGLSTTP